MPTTYPPSMKQVEFMWKLIAERGPLTWMDSDNEWAADLTKSEASDVISALLAKPRAPLAHEDGNAVGEGYYLFGGEDVFKVVAAKSTGNLYAKQFKVGPATCPGHLDHSTPSAFDAPFLYCNPGCKPGKASWEYAPGAMRKLVGAARLTLEQAAAMGRATGSCVVCARLLTNPESVAAGIGPVCAGRL